MFIRSKNMNGTVYYQVVHGYREPSGRVRHRTLISLGREPTIGDALESEERGLANLREERARLGDGPFTGRLSRRAASLDRMIDECERRIPILRELAQAVPGREATSSPGR